jgi:2-oxoglutarate ferredoxin oxidoreductase subunit alpha
MERLKKKYQTARQYVPAPLLRETQGATIGIIGYGSTEAAILETMHQLQSEHGIKADFLRIRALPFTKEVEAFLARHEQIFVVEMNRDGQMNQLLRIEYPQFATRLKSVAYGDGLPASARWVREGILARYEAKKAAAEAKVKVAAPRRGVRKEAVKSSTVKTKKSAVKSSAVKTKKSAAKSPAKKKTSSRKK